MGILLEHYHGVTEVAMKTWHLNNNNIFLQGEINQIMTDEFLMQLIYIRQRDELDKFMEVNIFIDSPGGNITNGLSIIDAIKISELPVNIIVTGMASSMAAVILACGEKGRRYIFPHARVMIHEPLISGNMQKSATSLYDISNNLLKTKKMINELLAYHTGRSVDEIDKLTEHDHWMQAGEAIEFGICDAIYSG